MTVFAILRTFTKSSRHQNRLHDNYNDYEGDGRIRCKTYDIQELINSDEDEEEYDSENDEEYDEEDEEYEDEEYEDEEY